MLVLLCVVFLLHLCCASNYLNQEVFDYHNDTYYKAKYAYNVVDRIFDAFTPWFFTILFCEFTYFENRLLLYTETFNYGYPVMLVDRCPSSNRSKVKPRLNIHGATTYIVTSEELSVDTNENVIDALFHTGVFKPTSAVIFVISVKINIDAYFYHELKLHFKLLWNRKITNSILVVWDGEITMFSYNPFKDKIIDVTMIKDISHLLESQYENMYGSPLRLSVYKKLFYDPPVDARPKCDSRLAIEIMKNFNATCHPRGSRDGHNTGYLLENGTAVGTTADLIDGYTDIELNARILKNSLFGYIDTTYPLIQDDMCFMVKKADTQSTFATVIQLITITLLSMFVVNVLLLILVSLGTYRCEKNLLKIKSSQPWEETVLDLVKCFLRQTVNIQFAGPVYRFLVLLIMMYSLVVNSAIDSIIISAITYPRYKPDISTLSKLFATNLTLGVHPNVKVIFQRSLGDETFDKIKHRIVITNDKDIEKVVSDYDFQYAVLLRKSQIAYLLTKPQYIKDGRPVYHIVDECVTSASIVYALQYGSPYLPKINNILHHLNQGGILNYWTSSESKTSGNLNLQSQESQAKKALTITNLKAVFIVWFVGILVSSIAFLCENVFGAFYKLKVIQIK